MTCYETKSPGKAGILPSDSSVLEADDSHHGMFLDQRLADGLLMGLDEARDLIDFGSVQVNGRQERSPCRKLSQGDQIRVHWPRGGPVRHYEVSPNRIIFRSSTILAYDKEAGIPSQQTPADGYNNLHAALQRFLRKEGVANPYVALHHRLDRETSGVMVFALDRSVNATLGKLFETRKVTKEYLAWTTDMPEQEEWVAHEDISRLKGRYCTVPRGQGKSAETCFRLLTHNEHGALLLALPRSGRTHQIRLHLAAAGLPIIGDRLYGGAPHFRMLLHAHRLSLPHPSSRKPLQLVAPIPEDWPPPHSTTIPIE